MQINHTQNGSKGSFFIKDGEDIDAEMTYSMAGESLMIIDHTEVSDKLRGKNIGYELVQAGVDFAREQHLKILPLCPFAAAVFKKKHSEYSDVLKGA